LKLSKQVLQERYGIVNPYDLAKRGGDLMIAVTYAPADNGLMARYAYWSVWRIGKVVDPTAHWQDRGSKTFAVRGREYKESARLEALAWASTKYGIKEWEKSPFGSYHPKGTIEKAVSR
jgi:hypothetical protein